MFHVKQANTFTLPLADDASLQLERRARPRDYTSLQQRIVVESTHRFGRLYLLDGDAMAAEADEFIIHESLAHLAAFSHPRPVRALVLGGGDGASARELLKHPSLTRIVIAELDPQVVTTLSSEIPDLSAGAFENPRVDLRIGDAAAILRQLQDSGKRFDLILFDLTAPDDPACAHLHGDDFLRLCAVSLAPGGLIHIQLGSPFYQPDKVRTIAHRLRQIFPNITPALIDVPLYGGPWLLARASLDPPSCADEITLADRLTERRVSSLRYYNAPLHLASAALPNYVRELLA